jgi:dTDP-4-dehydrorhamnose reductase
MTPRYLIIGASGFVGASLNSFLGPANALATYHSRPIAGGVAFNAAGMRLAESVLKHHKGLTHAFVLFGVTAIDACARDPQGTAGVNVASVRAVIDDLMAYGITPVFASSDAVFDGSRGMRTEEDTPHPVLTYGRHKVEIEEYLKNSGSRYTIARLSKVVSADPGTHSLLADWIERLESGSPIRCAHDQIMSPAYIDDVVTALIGLAQNNLAGIFNVCGPRPITRFEFLQTLVREIQHYRQIRPDITMCSIRDFPFAEARPLDTSMSPAKLYRALGLTFADMETVCRRVAMQRYGSSTRSEALSSR